ncbi:MAG: sporulation protein YtfJ [Alicyclobacillus sp. RIFOXYA1_FULL_53_8]|nr:MAG: sporulation protein YtfJ [Alicyclobacillus sp. RIFOXYA1_FULL_53_8]
MDHPIQGLMQTAMENIRGMIDVNTIIGDAVEAPDGTVILPVSKVAFGFAAGGSEFNAPAGSGHKDKDSTPAGSSGQNSHPFGGGSGGGVSIVPIGFLIVHNGNIRLLSTDNQNQLYDRLIDMTPILMEKVQGMFKGDSPAGSDVSTPSRQSVPTPPPTPQGQAN